MPLVTRMEELQANMRGIQWHPGVQNPVEKRAPYKGILTSWCCARAVIACNELRGGGLVMDSHPTKHEMPAVVVGDRMHGWLSFRDGLTECMVGCHLGMA
jgi:hypothetical protein